MGPGSSLPSCHGSAWYCSATGIGPHILLINYTLQLRACEVYFAEKSFLVYPVCARSPEAISTSSQEQLRSGDTICLRSRVCARCARIITIYLFIFATRLAGDRGGELPGRRRIVTISINNFIDGRRRPASEGHGSWRKASSGGRREVAVPDSGGNRLPLLQRRRNTIYRHEGWRGV